jgi:hypothetical protein
MASIMVFVRNAVAAITDKRQWYSDDGNHCCCAANVDKKMDKIEKGDAHNN